MMSQSYTVDDISKLLKVSKLTVYDLIKKGDIPAYRVGRQMRVDVLDFERYKLSGKREIVAEEGSKPSSRPIVITGQDESLDILARTLGGKVFENRPLRSYVGSLDGLIAMYQGDVDIVSTHLFDGDTKTYNIPYIRKLLVSKSFIVLKFIQRKAGLYVAKGNPQNINDWKDLKETSITMVNREAGSGARALLDEQLRIHHIRKDEVTGYENEAISHLAVASAVASGRADVGIGIKRVAQMTEIDFVPLITESYDLVILKTEENNRLIADVQAILKDNRFKEELESLNYTFDGIGEVIWEQ